MRAVYIERYYMTDSHNLTLTSLSVPITKRKNIKELIKNITREKLSFASISQDNIREYYEICKLFLNNSELECNVVDIKKYHRSKYCGAIFKMIQMEYEKHNKESLRVYIPYEYNKNFYRTLLKMIAKSGMNVSLEESNYDQSVFAQLSSIIAGCTYYHSREDLYFDNLGKTSQAQLVAYLYTSKKQRNKMNFYNLETITNIRN